MAKYRNLLEMESHLFASAKKTLGFLFPAVCKYLCDFYRKKNYYSENASTSKHVCVKREAERNAVSKCVIINVNIYQVPCACMHCLRNPNKQANKVKYTESFTFKVLGIMKHTTTFRLSTVAREDSCCEQVGVRFTLKD